MKTDSELKKDVIRRTYVEPDIICNGDWCCRQDGVVTLSGYVDSYHEKLAAERAAQGVFGVKAVCRN